MLSYKVLQSVRNRYRVLQTLKKDLHTVTYLAQDISKNILIIVKQIKISQSIEFPLQYQNILLFSHPNVVKIYDCYLDMIPQSGKYIIIVMEYICNSSLQDYLGKLSEQQILQIYQQINQALRMLHKQNILRSEIKLNNISLDKQKQIKLTDLRIACQSNIDNQNLDKFMIKDLWDFGIVMIQLITGTDIKQLYVVIMGEKYDDNVILDQQFIEQIFMKYNVSQKIRSVVSPLFKASYKVSQLYEITNQNDTSLKLKGIVDKHLKLSINQYHKSNLLQLDCYNCMLSNESSNIIKQLKTLQKLDVSGNNLTDQFVYCIEPLFCSLITFKIAFTDISNDSIFMLTKNPRKLRQLDISYTLIDLDGIRILYKLDKLQSLAIWSGKEYYPQRYQQIINTGNNQRKYMKNQIIINQQYIKQLCKLKLREICINAEGRQIDELVNGMHKESTCIQVRGNMNDMTLQYISKLQKLKSIYLHGVTNYDINQFQSKSLRSIALVGCEFDIKALPKSLQNHNQLLSLNLWDNKIDNDGAILIANTFHNLTSLNLRKNKLSNQGIIQIAKKLKKLTSLNLHWNKIGNQGVVEIANNLKSLELLNLHWNNIGNQGAIKIATNLKKLTSLNLHWNNIANEGAIEIAKNLKDLVSLDLGQNYIGSQGAIQIAKNLNNLRSLNLFYNKISKQGVMEIANNLKNLRFLSIGGNGLIGQTIQMIIQLMPNVDINI